MDQPRLVDRDLPLALESLSPLVVHSYYFSPAPGSARRLGMRHVTDYEFEFLLCGNGAQYIDGKRYPMEPGLVVYRRPGQLTEGVLPYECYSIIVDMEGKRRPLRKPYWRGVRGRPPQPDFDIDLLRRIPPRMKVRNPETLEVLFKQILSHSLESSERSTLIQKSLVLQILASLTSQLSAESLPRPEEREPDFSAFLDWVQQRFHKDIKLQDMADFLGYSPAYTHKLLSRYLGQSPLNYIHGLRIHRAKELLASTNMTMEELSSKCGFDNLSYFFRVFKRASGQTPGEFRKHYRLPDLFLMP